MKSTNLVNLINQIYAQNYLDVPHKCPTCAIHPTCHLHNIKTHYQIYNNLLAKVHKMININYEVIEEQQNQYEEVVQQLQKTINDLTEKNQDLESTIDDLKNTQRQYHNLLIEKSQYIQNLEDYHYKFQKNQIHTHNHDIKEIEILKTHKREKSDMFNQLENVHLTLIRENNKVKEENCRLVQDNYSLRSYIESLEEKLLSNCCITSPRTNTNNLILPSSEQLQVRINRQNSQSSPSSSSQYQPNYIDPRASVAQTLYPKNTLRDVLNISGQTSSHFRFRTKERKDYEGEEGLWGGIRTGQMGETRIIKQQNRENDFNGGNVVEKDKNKMEIKQFEVSDPFNFIPLQIQRSAEPQPEFDSPKSHRLEQQEPQKKDKKTFPSVDPYLAFFTLTVQCIKLNWKNMEEVANICLSDQYEKMIDNGIPINKWCQYLTSVLHDKVKKIN